MSKLWNADEDIRSLKSLILFGIRGMAAHAYPLLKAYPQDLKKLHNVIHNSSAIRNRAE